MSTHAEQSRTRARRIVGICIALFLLAFIVRTLTWQNNKVEMAGVQYVLTQIYTADAKTLLSGELGLFLTGPNSPSDAGILLHPPGYAIFLAVVFGVFGEGGIPLIPILINSLAPIIVFFIGLRLFETRVAAMAGFLVAVAPQFAYHSGLFLPDELSVLPILLAIYFFIRAFQQQRFSMAILCGLSLGLSCWFRSNALLLPIYFALGLLLVLPKQRVRFALVLIASFTLSISPITIRNYAVFKTFIPLSLGLGTTFVEGLGDYDAEGKLGMPNTDEGVMEMDVRLAERPDYYGKLYSPDGVERDRRRVSAGLGVVAANPLWYGTSVLHRGISTLRLERVPSISTERDEKSTTPAILYYLNAPLKLFQRLFISAVFLPLFMLGTVLMLRKKEDRVKFLILVIVPIYYATVQALIHTEYRYVLATPHILMMLAAVSLSFIIDKAVNAIKPASPDPA